MARVVVIGGSGHVGTCLVPALVERGHQAVNVSRGRSAPYRPHPAWAQVEQVAADRAAEDATGTFGARIAALRPDVVVDMISFDLPSTRGLVEALRGRVEHFLHCGTIRVHGQNPAVPATEDDPLVTFGECGTNKAAIETWLLHEARRAGFPATVFRPGHIVGPGWAPINPVGNANPEVFSRIARGEELRVPSFGPETVSHVHAADVAQVVVRAILHRAAALGEAFDAASPRRGRAAGGHDRGRDRLRAARGPAGGRRPDRPTPRRAPGGHLREPGVPRAARGAALPRRPERPPHGGLCRPARGP